ncbi:MAG: DUF2384 domain-containing protein [Alphaproteobacteria bacterium]|nr:DUF2384 domain-containing protein [Alphaproteobacteria bacterium]
MSRPKIKPPPRPEPELVLTKAVLRAADHLGLTAKILANVLGLSETTISRMKHGEYVIDQATKAFDLAVLFVRLFRSLDAIAGGDARLAAAWLRNVNSVLDARPVERMQTVAGLTDVIAYLDARRALV